MPSKNIGPGTPHRRRKLAWAKANRQKLNSRQNGVRAAHLEELAGRPKPPACEVCGRVPRKESLHWDHDHNTGEFRGWLCGNCNRALGLVGDNPTTLRNLASYLEDTFAEQ